MADQTRHTSITKSDVPPLTYAAPFSADYVLLLVVATEEVSSAEQAKISRLIIESPCRYALSFGYNSPAWEDTIDQASLDAGGEEDVQFIMTTSHEDEEIEEVVDFLWRHTNYDDFEPENFAIHILGRDPRLEARLRLRLAHLQEKDAGR